MKTNFICLLLAIVLTTGPFASADGSVWTVTDTRHMLRCESPGTGRAVTLGAARNEWVSFQIFVRSDQAVKGVRVEAGELGGSSTILAASEARLYRQHQLYLDAGTHRNESFKPDWFPDPLIPLRASLTHLPVRSLSCSLPPSARPPGRDARTLGQPSSAASSNTTFAAR